MKKLSIIAVSLSFIFLFSCSKIDEIENDLKPHEEGVIKGLKVSLPQGIPKEVLDWNEADFQKKFYTSVPSGRLGNQKEVKYDLEEFVKFASPVVNKYPNRANIKKMEMIEMIKKDFGFSEKDFDKNLNTILEYYQKIVAYELLKILPQFNPSPKITKNAKVAGYIGVLNSCEFWLVFWNSNKMSAVQLASAFANLRSSQDYPATWGTDGVGNAFRHSFWTAMLMDVLSVQGYPTYEAHAFAFAFTTAHECEENGSLASKMDLHNNAVALNTYPSFVGASYNFTSCGFLCWGYIPVFNSVGPTTCGDFYKNKADNNCVQVFSESDINNADANTLVRLD